MKRMLIVAIGLAAWCVWVVPCLALEQNVDRPGMDYRNFDLPAGDPSLCEKACTEDKQCKAFTYVKPGYQGPKARCWLKKAVPPAKSNDCCVSGVKGAAAPLIQGQPKLQTSQAKPMDQGQTPTVTSNTPHVIDPMALDRQKKLKEFDGTWKQQMNQNLKTFNDRLQTQMNQLKQRNMALMQQNENVLSGVQSEVGLCVTPEGIVEPCPPGYGESSGTPKPEITGYIATAHGINKGLEPGDEVIVFGRNFGEEQGFFSFLNADNKYKDNQIPYAIVKWTNGGVRIKIGDNIPGLIKPKSLIMSVEPKGSSAGAYRNVTLFPRMKVIAISGKAYFKGDWDGEKGEAVEQDNNFLKVSHDPECSWHDWMGNEGDDWFFKNPPLPDYVTIIGPIVQIIPPDVPNTVWEGFVDSAEKVLEMLWAAYNEDWTTIFKFFWGGWSKLFDDKAGSYVCKVEKKPSELDPSMRVHWENSCTGRFEGLPVEYMTTFILAYPEGYPSPMQ